MALRAIRNLRELAACDLEPLLREETAEWAQELDWDLSGSAGLVRKLADAHQLRGVALLDGNEVGGYGYCGMEEGKAQIWDAYVRLRWRKECSNDVLFRFLFDTLIQTPGVRRVEGQLMLAGGLQDARLRPFERIFMKLDLSPALPAANGFSAARFRFESWSDRHQDAAATALWLAHIKHVDTEMSEQYRTFTGARRFVRDLVAFPGCAFSPEASFVAFDNATRQVAGISLTSAVAAGVGHIAALGVMPQSRGSGLGYELLRRSAQALKDGGASRLSLAVTACNHPALRLYRRFGFQESRRFYAYAWDRPNSPHRTAEITGS
jgi:ribosomal protein S18 acetylase RimI-like enzyme